MSMMQSLPACLVRIAQLQQNPIDRSALLQAVADVKQRKPKNVKQAINTLSGLLMVPQPRWHRKPDPANMPLLAHNPLVGWFVVRGQNAHQKWIIETWLEDQQKFVESINDMPTQKNSQLVKLSLLKPFDSSTSPVYSLIKQQLFSHPTRLFEIMLATTAINILVLGTSLYSMQIYNRVIPTNAMQTLTVLTLGVLMALVVEYLMKHARSSLYDVLIDSVDQRLSRKIFMRLLSIRLDQLPSSVGSLAAQMNAYQTVRSFLTTATTHAMVDAPFVIIFLVLIALIGHPYLVAIPVMFFLVALFSGIWHRKRIEKLASSATHLSNFKTGILVETIEGAETIKSGQGGWRMLSRWMGAADESRNHEMRLRHITERNQHTTATLQQVAYVLIVALGALLVSAGMTTQGGLIACSILAGRILTPVSMLPALLLQWGHVKAALQGLDRIWKLEDDHHGQEHPLTPQTIHGNYALEKVSSSYRDSSQKALQVNKLQIQAGEKIGIIGPIGSGKTTLLRLLSGMYKPQEGRVLLDNMDITQLSKPLLAENMGFLAQEGRLFAGTLRENLILGLLDPGDDQLLAAAEKTGLLQLVIKNHPKGLQLPISEGGMGLSAGQRQLVNLTRVFLRKPKIWLLDEPTSSMDRQTEQQIIQALSETLRPTDTLVMTTHKHELLALVDRLIVVANHEIVLDGPKDKVLERLQNPNPVTPIRQQAKSA
ncbi:MAG: ATP-binding cassette domain-containing protein [Betaproteobacteria bacterium]|nr:ATP-binding cassette domain-containing protein [Betaproteobacteria bacterium]NBY33036.1 ATP-binding cassette domain-containing protein [Betaproteobacteria bacterium]